MGLPLKRYGQGIAEPIAVEERRDHEGLKYDWQPHKDGYQRTKNWKLVVPSDLTNFTNAGVLDPNQSQATAQAALLPSPPLPTEEWVCVEDYYPDDEQSVSETVWTSREVQPDSAASRSVCLALPSIDTAATDDTVPGLTVSHPCAVLPAPPSATAVAPQSTVHLPVVFASQYTALAASAQQLAFLAAQSVSLAAQPALSAAPPITQSAPPTI